MFILRCVLDAAALNYYSSSLTFDRVRVDPIQVDRHFIAWASAIHRCDVLIKHYRKTLHEMCDPILPDIGGIVKDDILYAEVMAKILTPRLAQEWNPFKVHELICVLVSTCSSLFRNSINLWY
jgi:RNA processing factor Prp31